MSERRVEKRGKCKPVILLLAGSSLKNIGANIEYRKFYSHGL